MILVVVASLLVLISGLYAFAPHPPSTPKRVKNVAELKSFFNQLVESGNPPGLSVVVVKDCKLVYNFAFGYSNKPHGEKSTPDIIYHWWSMTKIPTAKAIMQLQEQGKIKLDDSVAKYLPWFEVNYPSSESLVISIRNLMQHSSGLPDTMPSMISWVHYDDTIRNQTEVARKYLPKFNALKFEQGERAVYSNFNYLVLGALIEGITSQTYEAYIIDNFLQPLGMTQTDFVYPPGLAEHEASGTLPIVHLYTPLLPTLLDINALVYERQGKLLWLNRVYIDATPSTGLIGSAPDLARLMMAYFNRGILDRKRILSPESISLMTETSPIDGHGLGRSVGETTRTRFIEHADGGPGFAIEIRLYPDEELGIAILANGTDLDRSGLVDLLASMNWLKY